MSFTAPEKQFTLYIDPGPHKISANWSGDRRKEQPVDGPEPGRRRDVRELAEVRLAQDEPITEPGETPAHPLDRRPVMADADSRRSVREVTSVEELSPTIGTNLPGSSSLGGT